MPRLICPFAREDSARGGSEHGFRMINVDSRNLPTATAGALHKEVLRWCWRLPAAAATVAVTLAACSSFGGLTGDGAPPAPASTAPATPAPASSNASFASRVKAFFSGDSGNLNSPAPQLAAGTAEIECPGVEYRQGAATLAVNNPGAENTALSLRYQASFTQTARECILGGNSLTIKVGVQGRVVVGPAGGPGSINIPLRYALVREGAEPKTLWTKLFMVPVAIPQNQLNLPWLHIEEEMTVPRPSGDEIETYVIYIGFDPEGLGAARPKPAAKPRVARPR
ncbi:MAG TPA: hypothetical protein VNS33_06730 [Bradyrhizobium sp.]|nr:hypothetical protein [Bradyrhizobium sp.]